MITDQKLLLDGILQSYGETAWYRNGKLHRDNDLPAIISINGYQAWYKNGKRHRDSNRYAVFHPTEGFESYYQHGKLHRDNGPAIVHSTGVCRWFVYHTEINVRLWVKQNEITPYWRMWDEVTWSLFRLEFL